MLGSTARGQRTAPVDHLATDHALVERSLARDCMTDREIDVRDGVRVPAGPAGPAGAALDAVHRPVGDLLARFLADRVADLCALDPALEAIGREVEQLVARGGKRLRPAFVYWGQRATGAAHDDGIYWPAAAVELLHTFALIHDDVMDRSAERRGHPAVHASMAHAHTKDGMVGDPTWFGVGGAILAGDLAFVWADQLLDESPLPAAAVARARSVFTELRVEVMAGQYLDLRLAGMRAATEQDSLRVALLKSGRYTVTRPLQLGAAVGANPVRAGASAPVDMRALDAALTAYGDAVGLAFQLRDDVLGLFGDPSETGKGALEDLREGKRTVLILRALEFSGAAERAALADILGSKNLSVSDADRAREIVVASGALDSVERWLSEQLDRACDAVAGLGAPAGPALLELAELSLFRRV